MKFIAIQTGARRGYAVPLILEKAGILERFYTDLAGNKGIGNLIFLLRWIPGINSRVNRLSSRIIPNEIVKKTWTFDFVSCSALFKGLIGTPDPIVKFRRQVEFSEYWGRDMIRQGFGDATHVYIMLSEGSVLLPEAKRRGLRVISEIYIMLSTEKIMEAERRDFPTWEPDVPDYQALRRQFISDDVLMNHTDFYICPSIAVQYDLIKNWGVKAERTFLVPYGVHPSWLQLEPKPKKGRVLFVGTAELRKGIHYLALAAERLHQKGLKYEFRIAGNVCVTVRCQPVCKFLTFLGRVPRNKIQEEFQQADIFVLPSLAEGSAEVTYEALAAGVPLVVTQAAGSIVRDGIEGRIVPERDPEALADAIESIAENRYFRNKMAEAARTMAMEFTWKKYGERLCSALRNCI